MKAVLSPFRARTSAPKRIKCKKVNIYVKQSKAVIVHATLLALVPSPGPKNALSKVNDLKLYFQSQSGMAIFL